MSVGRKCQRPMSAGATNAMVSASNELKKVAVAMMARIFTCHGDTGSRSIRATIPSGVSGAGGGAADALTFSPPFERALFCDHTILRPHCEREPKLVGCMR